MRRCAWDKGQEWLLTFFGKPLYSNSTDNGEMMDCVPSLKEKGYRSHGGIVYSQGLFEDGGVCGRVMGSYVDMCATWTRPNEQK